jgi:hypothetical protein
MVMYSIVHHVHYDMFQLVMRPSSVSATLNREEIRYFNCNSVVFTSVPSFYINITLSDDGRIYVPNRVVVSVMSKWIYIYL